MGHMIVCGTCGVEVYTTRNRMPVHEDRNGKRCKNEPRITKEEMDNQLEYKVGTDGDPWVYQGGLPELGKDR